MVFFMKYWQWVLLVAYFIINLVKIYLSTVAHF
jgi:hypothetical protein